VIVADANIFLRLLVEPATPRDERAFRIARELFERVEEGRTRLLVTDAVVAEVVFILSHPRHYGIPRKTVVEVLLPLLTPSSCLLSNRDACFAALDLWKTEPRISFVDALVAMIARERGSQLATFDRRLQRVAGEAVWPPCREDAPAGA
jgi:predicted nucleic acid-binding protein